MPTKKRENLLRWKRRVDEDGEDEGSVAAELPDDSQSDDSGFSDEEDADNSDLSDQDDNESAVANGQTLAQAKSISQLSGAVRTLESRTNNEKRPLVPTATAKMPVASAVFPTEADTEAMMNGMGVRPAAHRDDGVNFESLGENGKDEVSTGATTERAGVRLSSSQTRKLGSVETPAERRRREHEEYKKKRDSDPAFIPNRGAFFMHDHRSPSGSAGSGASMRARGRGRFNGITSRAKYVKKDKIGSSLLKPFAEACVVPYRRLMNLRKGPGLMTYTIPSTNHITNHPGSLVREGKV